MSFEDMYKTLEQINTKLDSIKPIQENIYLTIEQASKEFPFTEITLYRYRKEIGYSQRSNSKSIIFKKSDIENWIERYKKGGLISD